MKELENSPKPNVRRLNGEGNIRKHPSRDLFQGRVRLHNADGKSHRQVIYGKTRGEVRDKISEARRRAKAGVTPTPGLTHQSD